MDIFDIVTGLASKDGVSGFESGVLESAEALVAPYCDRVFRDAVGNVVGYKACGVQNAATLMLDAHLDQIGFVVTEVLDGGFLMVQNIGGADPRMLPGCEVVVLSDRPLRGVFTSTPPHLVPADAKDRQIPDEGLYIDTGYYEANLKKSVKPGTPVRFYQDYAVLNQSSLCGRALDDRAGFAALVWALDMLKGEKPGVNLIILGSVREETGRLGAACAAYTHNPDLALCVDVGHAKTPDAPPDRTFEFGGGPMIGMGPNLHRGITNRLIRCAEKQGIRYQKEVMGGDTGTNASAVQISGNGVPCGLVSIPLRYMHTPVETVSMDDIKSTAELICHFVRSLDGTLETERAE